ncbi:uncharacterized protein LOC141647392 [Silene latifolia]|uniref:uncharacterized protein LOC141647392 n=1 Tax=Silene latifolia TaxID=37657 RepID=UPI003D783061
MSDYENVIAGKLRLKGKALNVKGNTKKKKYRKHYEQLFNNNMSSDFIKESHAENNVKDGNEMGSIYDERLTPAERRYLEHWKRIEAKRLLRNSCESHRDRVNKFNEYLANLSEHYDIPKVGPG